MVSGRDDTGNLPLSSTSSLSSATLGSSSSASLSSSTTTQFLNVLTTSGGEELTQVQHYNDLQRSKNTNMKSVKDVNLKRSQESIGLSKDSDIWKSIKDTSISENFSRRRLTHQGAVRDTDLYKETSLDKIQPEEININLNTENDRTLYSSVSIDENKVNWRHDEKRQNTDSATSQCATTDSTKAESVNVSRNEKSKSWWRGKLSSRTSTSSSHQPSSRSISSSIRRTRFWNSLSKTLELPDRLRKDDKKIKKVPKLQIWLSTDSRNKETEPPVEDSVLNNTRDVVPRIQLDQANVINRSLVDGCRWRALSEGSYPNAQDTNLPLRVCNDAAHNGPKSPVEKQPTWPVCYLLKPRPKLRHQNCLYTQSVRSQDSEIINKRLELPRQNAISEEAEVHGNEVLKPEEIHYEWKQGSFSTESQASTNLVQTNQLSEVKRPLGPRLSAASTGGHKTLGINFFFGRRGTSGSRSYSDDKNETYDVAGDQGPHAAPSFTSVFSLSDPPSTPSPSWASSHASLRSDFPSGNQVGSQSQVSRSPSINQEFLTPSLRGSHPPCSRSNSTASSSIFSFADRSQFRLTIPGSDKRRRPSLLSLRSFSRSPVPYVSMDYDFDSEYQALYSSQGGLIPEAIPKLSFTQKLAFPTLHQNSIDRPKPRDPYTEADNNMNTVAKIITTIILTFVTVVILVGLYKIIH